MSRRGGEGGGGKGGGGGEGGFDVPQPDLSPMKSIASIAN